MRSDCDVAIYVDIAKAVGAGIKFYWSTNKVILTSGVNGVLSPDYFLRIDKV